MRFPFPAPADQREYLEPPRSPLLPLSCLLAVVVAIAVVYAQLGGRLALMTAGFAAASLATRLPRVLPVTAALALLVAAVAVLGDSGSASVVAAHALAHAAGRR